MHTCAADTHKDRALRSIILFRFFPGQWLWDWAHDLRHSCHTNIYNVVACSKYNAYKQLWNQTMALDEQTKAHSMACETKRGHADCVEKSRAVSTSCGVWAYEANCLFFVLAQGAIVYVCFDIDCKIMHIGHSQINCHCPIKNNKLVHLN